MKIALITPTPPDISAFGVRIISAFLRMYGHETVIIFLPGSIGRSKEGGSFVYNYPQTILKQIVEICRSADLIGVSFMTNYFDRAVSVTRAIKKELSVPVVWGGIHASTKPEEALDHADIVCIGEGENPLLELLERIKTAQSYWDVRGFWFKKDGHIIRNGVNSLVNDLNTLPFFDYSNQNHFVYDLQLKQIVPLTVHKFKDILPLLPYFHSVLKRAYRTMTTRGCPHRCTYCNVPKLMEVYSDGKTRYFRFRDIENVIRELVEMRRKFPFVEAIQFFDDTFFARPLKEIEQFSKQYKEQVGLPFYCQASPTTITKAKLELLMEAGLVYVEMGIQTGSAKIKEIYNRKESNEKILEATRLLASYRSKLLPPDYHIITDNPWETEKDVMDTVRLLFQIQKPYGLCISSLVFFPHTDLYFKAKEKHLFDDEVSDIYRRPFYIPAKKTYPNFLIYLFTFQHFPRTILAFLIRDTSVRFFSKRNLGWLYALGYSVGEMVRLFVKGIKVIRHGKIGRITAFVKKLMVNDPVVAGRKS